jgi:hypothetical protein
MRADSAGEHFSGLGNGWHIAGLVLGWLTATLAGIAGVSVVSDNKYVTASLAIAAALVAAANAAFNPVKRSRRAYELAYAFKHVGQRAKEFISVRLPYISLDEAMKELVSIREALDAIEDRAVRTHDQQ